MRLADHVLRRNGSVLDHVGLGVPDMTAGCDWFELRTGVRPWVVPEDGGQVGVLSAVVPLGEGPQAIEIAAPDPASPDERSFIAARLRDLPEPRLQFWYIAVDDIAAFEVAAKAQGLPFLITNKALRGADGAYTYSCGVFGMPDIKQAAFAVPMVIQWISKPSRPNPESARDCRRKEMFFEHDAPDTIRRLFDVLELDVTVRPGPEPQPRLTIEAAGGEVTL